MVFYTLMEASYLDSLFSILSFISESASGDKLAYDYDIAYVILHLHIYIIISPSSLCLCMYCIFSEVKLTIIKRFKDANRLQFCSKDYGVITQLESVQ